MPIAAIVKSHVFTANAHYVFGDLRTWDWITLPDADDIALDAFSKIRNRGEGHDDVPTTAPERR